MPADANTDAVKRLTDDEVANIRFDLANTKPSSSPMGLFRQHCEDLLNEHDALRATVRALQAKYDAEEKDHRLTIDTFRQQERIWQQKFDEQESATTALREQLAHVLVCSGSPNDCEACTEAASSVRVND